jgi:hypothetical protein
MTKVTVTSGACGCTVIITAEKMKDKKIRVALESECEMVMAMAEDVASLDMMMALFTDHLNNPVYRSAARHIKHAACPEVIGILKAVEVEAGMAVPRDVHIVFSKE